MDEYIKLKEKEKQVGAGGLTPEEQQRLRQINQSEEFKRISAATIQEAKNDGVKLTGATLAEAQKYLGAVDKVEKKMAADSFWERQSTPMVSAAQEKTDVAGGKVSENASFGHSHFSTAPELSPAFASSAAIPIASTNKNPSGPASDDDFAADAVSVAQTQGTTRTASATLAVNA